MKREEHPKPDEMPVPGHDLPNDYDLLDEYLKMRGQYKPANEAFAFIKLVRRLQGSTRSITFAVLDK